VNQYEACTKSNTIIEVNTTSVMIDGVRESFNRCSLFNQRQKYYVRHWDLLLDVELIL